MPGGGGASGERKATATMPKKPTRQSRATIFTWREPVRDVRGRDCRCSTNARPPETAQFARSGARSDLDDNSVDHRAR
jgi:hypothetical protein